MDRRILHRFLSKIEFGNNDDCWIWIGAKSNNGTGIFALTEQKYVQSHRFMYEITHKKPLDRGTFAKHICGNKLCVNPSHLDIRDIEKRFWSFVNRQGRNDCWNWIGNIRGGYGRFSVSGLAVPSHRYSYELYNDIKLSDDDLILHSCHNRKCVNPSHLRIGDNQDNMNDMKNANRQAKGVKNGQSKLLEKDVIEIKSLLKEGKLLNKEIAEKFSIAPCTVTDISRGRTWSWL
jgi:hypothetical protein